MNAPAIYEALVARLGPPMFLHDDACPFEWCAEWRIEPRHLNLYRDGYVRSWGKRILSEMRDEQEDGVSLDAPDTADRLAAWMQTGVWTATTASTEPAP